VIGRTYSEIDSVLLISLKIVCHTVHGARATVLMVWRRILYTQIV
jgi:hypothetical protein